MISSRSRSDVVLRVQLDRRLPADLRVRAVDRRARPRASVARSRPPRRSPARRSAPPRSATSPSAVAVRPRRSRARRPLWTSATTSGACAGVRDDDRRRRRCRRGSAGDSTSCPATDSTSVRNTSDCAVPDALSCGRNAAPTSSTSVVTIQIGARLRPTRPRDAAPQPAGLRVRRAELRLERPERAAAEQREHGGQERDRGQQRGADADRGDRAEALVRVEVAEQQAQHAEDDRAGRGGDGLDRAAPRRADGASNRSGVSRSSSRNRETSSNA